MRRVLMAFAPSPAPYSPFAPPAPYSPFARSEPATPSAAIPGATPSGFFVSAAEVRELKRTLAELRQVATTSEREKRDLQRRLDALLAVKMRNESPRSESVPAPRNSMSSRRGSHSPSPRPVGRPSPSHKESPQARTISALSEVHSPRSPLPSADRRLSTRVGMRQEIARRQASLAIYERAAAMRERAESRGAMKVGALLAEYRTLRSDRHS